MKVIVTGATGFVGRHVVRLLVKRGHTVIAVARNENKAKEFDWYFCTKFISLDLHKDGKSLFDSANDVDALIHLAWSNLPNYTAAFHLTENLPADLIFLKEAIKFGIPQIIVSGTCLEYGIQSGALSEDTETKPSTPYGLAKDTLRRSIEYLQQENSFILKWIRLFYVYGEGQNSNSLLPRLETAIKSGDHVFNMSMGTQIRDYLPIEKVAENFALALESPSISGVVNCCSGVPIKISDLVQHRIRELGSNIILNKGYYSIPEYEALEFWGTSMHFN